MTEEQPNTEMTEQEMKQRYEERITQLQENNGWSRRKARRALDAHSKSVMKKFIKNQKARD